MSERTKTPAWPWLALIVVLATAYVWWLALGALAMQSGG
jgi:hypothetical protein